MNIDLLLVTEIFIKLNEGFEGLAVLPAQRSYGFIAQEVKQNFPELRKGINLIAMNDGGLGKHNRNEESYTAINYIGFIPILTQGVKNQKLEQEIILIKQMIMAD